MNLADLSVSPEQSYTEEERRNRDVVPRFYDAGVNQRDYDAAFALLGDQYIQHNPYAADGPEGFAGLFDGIFKQLPDFRIEMRRVFVQDDLVAVQVRSHDGPSPHDEVGTDIFRVENGKVVEHWDVIRPVDEGVDPDALVA
ncbi:MAG TPA: nuclear transport factor 2 family protein [Sphingomonadaceae bacterium]